MAWPIDPELGFFQARAVDAFGADTGGRSSPHSGVDFAPYKIGAPIPVYAVETGTVFYVGGSAKSGAGPGLNVRIEHPSGYWLYGHLSRLDVRQGETVKAGQQLGLMGASGGTNGVHLHVTRFTTRAAALANGVPSNRLGRTVAAWAAANSLADPMEVIGRAGAGGSATTKPADPGQPTITVPEEDTMPIIARTTNPKDGAAQYFAVTDGGIAPFERTETKELNTFRQVLTAMQTARSAGVTDIAVSVYQLRTYRDYVNRANGRKPFVPDVLAK